MLYAGSDVRVNVNIVASQDTTGLMISQELSLWRRLSSHQLWMPRISLVAIHFGLGQKSAG